MGKIYVSESKGHILPKEYIQMAQDRLLVGSSVWLPAEKFCVWTPSLHAGILEQDALTHICALAEETFCSILKVILYTSSPFIL